MDEMMPYLKELGVALLQVLGVGILIIVIISAMDRHQRNPEPGRPERHEPSNGPEDSTRGSD